MWEETRDLSQGFVALCRKIYGQILLKSANCPFEKGSNIGVMIEPKYIVHNGTYFVKKWGKHHQKTVKADVENGFHF